MSLADVAARVRAASERNAAQLQREVPPAFRQPEARGTEPRIDAPEATGEAQASPPRASQPAEAATAPISAPAPKIVAVRPPIVQATEVSVPAIAKPMVEDTLLRRIEDEQQPALLSHDAGLQVARSFEELAAAIDGAERRSLDEIAEDMLRPMLRDWLDDNLPTLVERLVREEIERVARGPRR
jgi:uncharacterized protein